MAKIIKRKNSLQKRYISVRNKLWRRWVIPPALLVASIILFCLTPFYSMVFPLDALPHVLTTSTHLTWVIFGVGIISIPLIAFLNKRQIDEKHILKSGIDGEKSVLQLLNRLPSDFVVIPDVQIEIPSGTSQLDFVVISPHAIWVIESKHMNGKITGNALEEHWKQLKIGRGGSMYRRQFYNPVKQVGTHVYRLKETLKANGIQPVPWIQGVIYFSNSNAVIDVMTTKQHPVLFSPAALIEYMTNDSNRQQGIHVDQNHILSILT